jgi:large repetitive protein
MDRGYRCVLFVTVLACMLVAGCGGGSATKLLETTTTSLPGGTVSTPYLVTLGATGGAPPYTWSQSSGGAMPGGVILANTGTLSGTPTTTGTFGPYVFEVKDTSNNTSMTGSLSITITASSLSVTTTSLPAGTVGTAYSVTLAASGGTSPYRWAQTSGGALPPGISAVTSAGVIAGTPTAAGTYGPYVFTVTDAKSTTASSASLSITIAASTVVNCPVLGNESALTSANPYAFLVKGTDGSGNPIDIAGSFTPDGQGGIANAAVDYNGLTNGPQQMQVNVASSSYAFSSSGQGCLFLSFSGLATASASAKHEESATRLKPADKVHARKMATAEASSALVSTVQFAFNLSGYNGTVYQTGRIIESDNTTGTGTNASGYLYVQAPSDFALAVLQPNYAFGVDGWQITSVGTLSALSRAALAGTFSNASGTLSAGYADLNTGGTPTGELTGGHGSLEATVDPTTGRGTGSYFLTLPTSNLTFDFAFYILNGSDVILISTDSAATSTTTALLAGRALASNASYAPGPLNGYYLLASEGLGGSGSSNGNFAEIGTLNATSAGTIPTATIYSNDAGTYSVNPYPNSSYTVEAASGRASITGLTATPPVIYLTSGTSDEGIAGFLVGTDAESSSGLLVTQTTTAPSYTDASVTGNYAASTAEDVDGLNGAYLGLFTFSGAGAYTVVSQKTGSVPNSPSLGTIAVNADGSGSLDGGAFPFVTNGEVLFAIPDSGDPLLFILTQGTLP